jgi:hypothetical protein
VNDYRGTPVAVAALSAEVAELHRAIEKIWKAHRVAATNGGGAWKRHVEPAISEAAALLPDKMRRAETSFLPAADDFDELLG